MNDRELMSLRADTLFTYDARGRMVQSNEPCEAARRPAPQLFLGWTRGGGVVRFGETFPDSVAQRAAELVERERDERAERVPSSLLTAVREALKELEPLREEEGGPAYRFPPSILRRGEVVRLTAANREFARETYPWLYEEIADWQPCFAVVSEGMGVSICFSSRLGRSVAEAGVDTLSAYRGRGFAAAVTAAWGASIRDAGRIPLYSTGWENLASQGVARHLGLIMFGADATWQ
jgi:GNAT acetyltransferase-like protein